jgi:hypothetical protein
MAAPQVAGAVALLRQRHPGWSVAQIKSALVLTGDPVFNDIHQEVPSTREGGGLIDLPKADNPLVFADPTGISFGLLRVGTQATRTVQLTDAGGGAGDWSASVVVQDPTSGVAVSVPASVTVPGGLAVQATAAAGAAEADVTGFVVLQQGTESRRIPFWLRSERPRLEKPSAVLRKAGVYKGNTRTGGSRVSSYRYPESPGGAVVPNNLPGPEQVFRVVLSKRVRNFGVVVTGEAGGVSVTPRIVFPGDENRLVGVPALPLNVDPYQDQYGEAEPVVAVLAPASRVYDVVFDTRGRTDAGPFTFRLWIDDAAPPSAKLLTPTVGRSGRLLVSVQDKGSGVNPDTLAARIDGSKYSVDYVAGNVGIALSGLAAGKHTLELTVSDYQETKNFETFGGILPNTRVYRLPFTAR